MDVIIFLETKYRVKTKALTHAEAETEGEREEPAL